MKTETRFPPIQNEESTNNVANSGCTGHFFLAFANSPLINIQVATKSVPVKQPDGSFIYSTHTAELDTPLLPKKAREAHLFPNLEQGLISIGQLCDSGCEVLFEATSAEVHFEDNIILVGHRSQRTRLWHLNLASTPIEQSNNNKLKI